MLTCVCVVFGVRCDVCVCVFGVTCGVWCSVCGVRCDVWCVWFGVCAVFFCEYVCVVACYVFCACVWCVVCGVWCVVCDVVSGVWLWPRNYVRVTDGVFVRFIAFLFSLSKGSTYALFKKKKKNAEKEALSLFSVPNFCSCLSLLFNKVSFPLSLRSLSFQFKLRSQFCTSAHNVWQAGDRAFGTG